MEFSVQAHFLKGTALSLALALLTFSSITVLANEQVGRLRVFVAGRELPAPVQAEQRGQQILVPVVPVARELGYIISIDQVRQTIVVQRVGIEAQFLKPTSEITENGLTITTVPNAAEVFFTGDTNLILLPIEILSPLLNVSVTVDRQKNIISIDNNSVGNSISARQKRGLEVGSLNYSYGGSVTQGFFTQNLFLISNGRIGNDIYETNVGFVGGRGAGFLRFFGGNFTLNRSSGEVYQAGDLTRSGTSGLTFSNVFVRGASYDRPIFGDKGRIGVFGGRAFTGGRLLTNRQFSDEETGLVRDRRNSFGLQFDSTAYGANFTYNPYETNGKSITTKRLNFSTGALSFNNSDFTGRIVNGAVRYGTDKLNLEAEVGAGNFNLKQLNGTRTNGIGTGLDLNASYVPWKFLTLNAQYERFSPNFYGTQRFSGFNNRETFSVGANIAATSRLYFGGSIGFFRALKNQNVSSIADISQNNLTNPVQANQNTFVDQSRTTSYSLSFGYDPPTKYLPRISANLSSSSNLANGNFRTLLVTLSREYGRYRPIANYSQFTVQNNTSHNVALGLGIDGGKYGQYQLQHNRNFSQNPLLNRDFQCQLDITQCIDSVGSDVNSVRGSRFISNGSSGSVDWFAKQQLFGRIRLGVGVGYLSDTTRTSYLVRATSTIALPYRQNLQLSYNRTTFGGTLQFALSGPLLFGKTNYGANSVSSPVNENGEAVTESTIQGRVFLDENLNRTYDPGIDKSIPNVRVQLNNGRVVVSDENGLYAFDQVYNGENKLVANYEDIRADLVPTGGLELDLQVTSRSIVNASFRLVKSGSVSGQVFFDKNGNGIYDIGEGLVDIHVVSSSGRDTYTNDDGTFLISEVQPGEQSIFIDNRYVPVGLMGISPSLRVQVNSGQETKNVEFQLKAKPRTVKELDFTGSKQTPAPTPQPAQENGKKQ